MNSISNSLFDKLIGDFSSDKKRVLSCDIIESVEDLSHRSEINAQCVFDSAGQGLLDLRNSRGERLNLISLNAQLRSNGISFIESCKKLIERAFENFKTCIAEGKVPDFTSMSDDEVIQTLIEGRMPAYDDEPEEIINALLEDKEVPILRCQELMIEDKEFDTKTINEAAPSDDWEPTIKKMKASKKIDNPWALAWWMSKKGYTPAKVKESIVNEDAAKRVAKLKSLLKNIQEIAKELGDTDGEFAKLEKECKDAIKKLSSNESIVNEDHFKVGDKVKVRDCDDCTVHAVVTINGDPQAEHLYVLTNGESYKGDQLQIALDESKLNEQVDSLVKKILEWIHIDVTEKQVGDVLWAIWMGNLEQEVVKYAQRARKDYDKERQSIDEVDESTKLTGVYQTVCQSLTKETLDESIKKLQEVFKEGETELDVVIRDLKSAKDYYLENKPNVADELLKTSKSKLELILSAVNQQIEEPIIEKPIEEPIVEQPIEESNLNESEYTIVTVSDEDAAKDLASKNSTKYQKNKEGKFDVFMPKAK